MTISTTTVRRGAYADSVTLMQVSQRALGVPGVISAQVAMGTELNLELLRGMGFAVQDGWGANDLIIAVQAEDEHALHAGQVAIEAELSARPAPSGGSFAEAPPRTVSAAARSTGPALALISVPGPYAFTEAMDALTSNCDVMIFSDNVPVEQEIRLKQEAARRGLLVMGPDCGTAVVGGVGLGFSHTLEPGPVGLVAASGTGAQQVLCLLDAAGVGVSAALGVGGRDLSAAVGGLSTRAALDALDADPVTELIVVVSKPPDAAVAAQVRDYAAGLATPVQFALIGAGQPDLTEAAATALAALGREVPDWPHWLQPPGAGTPAAAAPRGGHLRGLFAGGTLCDEAMVIASATLGEIRSNIPLQPSWRIDPSAPSEGHVMIDFGDDELTRGRPHPMIDQSLRLQRLEREAADPSTAVILLDVVLGHGAHPDPALELAPAIAACGVPVVVSVIGAKADPQDLNTQAAVLHRAGAHVFTSNAQAARFARDLIGG